VGRAVAYGSHDGGLRELIHLLLIHLLKYNGVRPAANILGRMLAEPLTALEPGFERLAFAPASILVVRVPLCKAKRRQRGFNQELIARAALKVPLASERLQLAPDILLRTRDTPSRIGLSSHQRRSTLRGTFAVERAADVTGREVILVDDVYTTSGTAAECAQVLRRAGASKVWVATVARTLKLASNHAEFRRGMDIDEDAAAAVVEERHDRLAKAAGS
jgi:ComF family protein